MPGYTSIAYKLNSRVTSYVPEAIYSENKEGIDDDLILRKAKNGESAMQATELLDVIPPGIDVDLKEIPHCNVVIDAENVKPTCIPIEEVVVEAKAKWFSSNVKMVKSHIETNLNLSANIFGEFGCFELVDYTTNLELPVVELECLSDADLATFGAKRLTPSNSIYKHFNTFNENLFVVVYDFNEHYMQKYVLEEELGGGWSIETHNFPHIFKPMRADCGGAVILGKKITEDTETKVGLYQLVSIKINFPDALAIESEVIHGNSSFTGPYAITSNPHGKASPVLMRTNKDEMQMVSQPNYKNPHAFFQKKPSPLLTACSSYIGESNAPQAAE